jgi:hypothetical protein
MSVRMTTDIRFRVFANLYKDSVALMQVGAALRKRPGVDEASCMMATPANLAQLQHADLSVDADVHPSDLLSSFAARRKRATTRSTPRRRCCRAHQPMSRNAAPSRCR